MAAGALAADQTVGVGNGAFDPQTVTIDQGEKVTWRWNGPDTAYSVTSAANSPEAFDSDPGRTPAHNVGDTFSHTFVSPGTYNYADKVTGIKGVVIVRDTGDTPSGGDATPPKIRSFRATPRQFCRRKSENDACDGRVRTKLKFRLNEAGSLALLAVRTDPGHRKITSFSLGRGKVGNNTKSFSAKRLVPGKYRFDLVATDRADNSSRTARTRVTVIDATSGE